MKYDVITSEIKMSIDELAEFAFHKNDPSALTQSSGFSEYSQASAGSSYSDAVTSELCKTLSLENHTLSVSGKALVRTSENGESTIIVKNIIPYNNRFANPFSTPSVMAAAAISGYIYADMNMLSSIRLDILFTDKTGDTVKLFSGIFSAEILRRSFMSLVGRCKVFRDTFYERYSILPGEIKGMLFPYREIRDGQTEFIQTAYRTIRHGGGLLVSAPTGIGKTISSLFPAVKSIGDGITDKVFYFTAKTSTARTALDTIRLIVKYAPRMRAVIIYAKELLCPYKKKTSVFSGEKNCWMCDNINPVSDSARKVYISYRERQVSALTELLGSSEHVYTKDLLLYVADKYMVCPYELSLDLSMSCQVIVCDYNYVLDDKIRFMRYFKNPSNEERYVFLFDEAHNIPDRTRNTYSAVLPLTFCDSLAEFKNTPDDSCGELISAIDSYLAEHRKIIELRTENGFVGDTDGISVSYGYYENSAVPANYVKAAQSLSAEMRKFRRVSPEAWDACEPLYAAVSKVVFAASFFDEKFRFFAARENERASVEILCIDPSTVISDMLKPARSVVMFSATLSPIDYYSEMTGIKNPAKLELESPFEKGNLCLVAYDSISTRLTDRKKSALTCAEVILETVSAKEGNYLVYFPSYDYMRRICKVFASLSPNANIVMQHQGMSYNERERFINIFRNRERESIVGFCVLGGIFSEGIDLAGESLIGAIVIGTGMPQLSAERNIMEAYYQEKSENGHEYAYVLPGINKVLQAAGRVIRSENDRGVVVLVDDRYAEPGMKVMFPLHWRHIKYTSNLPSLQSILENFWSNGQT